MFHYNNVDNIQICMDVPFVDHPYLIGPRGRKCQHLMDKYKSLVHFPDSNRRQNGPKLNNVVINGSSKNAEELRFQLRSRTPIRLAIQLQIFSDAFEIANRMETAITERSLPIRMNCSDDYSSAMLKTEWRNEDALISFCDEFLLSHSALMFASNNPDVFTMALTILPIVNPWNADISHWLIEHIFDVTGCRVFYPPKEKFSDQPPSYFIKGGTSTGVLKAGKFMLGLTMFQVSFIIPNSVNLNIDKIADWQRELLVHTSIEPVYSTINQNNNNNSRNINNQEFLHHRAVLRSFEFCLNSVYFVRSLLLGFKKTVQSSFYNFMSDVKHLIPYSVFSDAQLYYPLYAIDDERSFDWESVGEEFFQKFYGGPNFANTTVTNRSLRNSKSPITTNSSSNLTMRLQELLKIRIVDSNNNGRLQFRNNNNNNSERIINKNSNNSTQRINNNKSFGSCANSNKSFNNTDDSVLMINSNRCDNVSTPYNYRYVESINSGMNSSFITDMSHNESTGSSSIITSTSNIYESGCVEMPTTGFLGIDGSMTLTSHMQQPTPIHPMRQFLPPQQIYHPHYFGHHDPTINRFYTTMQSMDEISSTQMTNYSSDDMSHYNELEQFHQFHQEHEIYHHMSGHLNPHFFTNVTSTPIPEHEMLQDHQEQHNLALQMYHQQQYYQQQLACGMVHVPPLQNQYNFESTATVTQQVETSSPPPNTPTRLYQRWSRLSQSQPSSGSQRKSASF